MLRAYNQGGRPTGAPVGTVVYIQDNCRPMGGRSSFAPVICRDPWIIEGWQPREVTAAARDAHGRWTASRYYARGGHLARVRSLRTGRRATVADWLINQSLALTE